MIGKLSRRSILRLLGMSAGAAAVPSFGQAATGAPAERATSSHPPMRDRSFPDGFLWGSATASYQVEGAVHEDGRGASIWDTFSHTPGKTHNGDTGDVADDYFHRYKEDIGLMRELGLKTCRFSVAWSRVFPNGTGAPNPRGLDFYNRMVDELLRQGIQPYCTLYHWDLPQALEDKGGWQNRDTALAFADYAGYTVGHLSDRVKQFMTMNEIRSFTEAGYRDGVHAPGLKVDAAKFAQICHYAVLGHGLAVQAIRAKAKPGTQVGIADNVTPAVPVIEDAANIAAAEKGIREMNAMFLTVIQEGRYTDGYLRRLGRNAPKFTPEELQIIGSKLDFTGINIYQPTWVRAPLEFEMQNAAPASYIPDGFVVVEPPSSYPHMFSSWLTIGPETLYWGPKLVNKLWEKNAIYITENGTSSADVVTPDGHIWDTDRVMYLRNYLTQLQRAITEDVPVKGYFLWSLLDNFEWADGYEKRFGITYVDFKTQQRTPKLSFRLYQEIIRRNALA